MATKAKTRKKSVVRGKAATATKKKAKRTVLYSRSGKKLYAKRSKTGKFTDIQSYQRAHSADLKRTSKAERAGRARKAKKSAKPAAVSRAKTKTTTKARAAGAPKKVARKKVKPVAAAAAAPPRRPRSKRGTASTVRQVPRSQQSYAISPKPATEPVVELAVPELAVRTSVQGEVPAGGE